MTARTLDVLVHRHVFRRTDDDARAYSTDWQAASRVWEVMAAAHGLTVVLRGPTLGDTRWRVAFYPADQAEDADHGAREAHGADGPQTVCEAALRAIGAELPA